MEHEVELYDENDRPYNVTVEVEYDATPEEYEAGYYFAGGVEILGAKVLSIEIPEPDEGEEPAIPLVNVGDKIELSDHDVEQLASQIRRDIASESRGGRYPRMNISPDW